MKKKKKLHNIGSECRRVRQARQCKSVSNAGRCGPMPTNMRGKKQATELKTVWAVAPLRSAPPAGEPPADKEHKYRHMPMRRCAGRWPAPCNAELTHRLKWYGYQLQLVETFTKSPRYMFRRSSSCQRSKDTSNSLSSTNEHADSS